MAIVTRPLIVLDPTAETAPARGLVAKCPSSLNGKRIGLLANGKRNSDELLDAVLDLLTEHYRVSSISRYNKGNASRPASREIIEKLARECDVAVTATGD